MDFLVQNSFFVFVAKVGDVSLPQTVFDLSRLEISFGGKFILGKVFEVTFVAKDRLFFSHATSIPGTKSLKN